MANDLFEPSAEPASLSEEYHRARRNLNLASGLLFAREYVGITVGDKAAEVVGGIPLSIKSPDAAPWILLTLVLFFWCRLALEWGQCAQERRRVLLARLDVTLSTMIAGAAVAAFAYQHTTRTQLFDVGGKVAGLAVCLFSTAMFWACALLIRESRTSDRKPRVRVTPAGYAITATAILGIGCGGFLASLGGDRWIVAAAVSTGIGIASASCSCATCATNANDRSPQTTTICAARGKSSPMRTR